MASRALGRCNEALIGNVTALKRLNNIDIVDLGNYFKLNDFLNNSYFLSNRGLSKLANILKNAIRDFDYSVGHNSNLIHVPRSVASDLLGVLHSEDKVTTKLSGSNTNSFLEISPLSQMLRI